MAKGGTDHFERFQPHTLLKHSILDRYLKQWAQKLLRGMAAAQVWYVDAFAGEGGDKEGHPGSPVIAGRIALEMVNSLGRSSDRAAPMRVLAYEIDEDRCARLRVAMEPFLQSVPKIAIVRCGTLHERLHEFIAHVGEKPTLFFLDPFGVDGLVLKDLPLLLAGPRNEVLALFSDTGARRLYATLRTPERDVAFEVEQVLAQPTLFPEMAEEDADKAKSAAEAANRGLIGTQQAARRILAESLGEAGLQLLAKTPDEDLLNRATEIWMQALLDAGARFVFSVPMRDAENAHVYQLVFSTKSATGLVAMKGAMQAALNKSPLPAEVVDAIRQELQPELADIIGNLASKFAGRTVRWSEVRGYLLEQTPLLPDQVTELRHGLDKVGWVVGKKPWLVRFPGAG